MNTIAEADGQILMVEMRRQQAEVTFEEAQIASVLLYTNTGAMLSVTERTETRRSTTERASAFHHGPRKIRLRQSALPCHAPLHDPRSTLCAIASAVLEQSTFEIAIPWKERSKSRTEIPKYRSSIAPTASLLTELSFSMATTFDPSHPYHRPRRLDDYYSYADDTWRQHPHYTLTMLIVLGLLLAFIAGYAIYQLGNRNGSGDDDDDLIKEVCSFGAADDDADQRKRESRRDPEWSSIGTTTKIEMTTCYNPTQRVGSEDAYVSMPDVTRAVTT